VAIIHRYRVKGLKDTGRRMKLIKKLLKKASDVSKKALSAARRVARGARRGGQK